MFDVNLRDESELVPNGNRFSLSWGRGAGVRASVDLNSDHDHLPDVSEICCSKVRASVKSGLISRQRFSKTFAS
jgi:hypothetical protein